MSLSVLLFPRLTQSTQVFVRPKGQDSEISDDHAGTSKKNDESEDRQAAQVTTPVGHKREV